MRQYINQLKDNDTINEIYFVTEKQLRPNKNGIFYIQMTISDRTGSVSVRVWNASEELFQSFATGDFVRLEGATQRYQGSIQIIGKTVKRAPQHEVNFEDFRKNAQIDQQKLRHRLIEVLQEVTNPTLRNLLDCFLIDEVFMEKFSRLPAGVRLHHAYAGGLLEHTVTMLEVTKKITPLYPMLNADLLMTGVFLHDIGKTVELTGMNEFTYSDEGQILGHPTIAVEILHEKIRETEKLTAEPFDPEIAMILKHMMISHHGAHENGSAKLPMTLEAIALHYIDSLDSKLTEFEKYMFEDPNAGSHWTNYIPIIDRKLYKGKRKN
ncbi:MAG: HD domain-containing protein [Planctomycetaceae bacterium]|jgi:3'-5' exoribonuclease|nr:HD domain-containing protein [Planctomycetaceae bacterium]